MENDILQKLAKKEITKEELIKRVELNFQLLPLVVEGVSSPKAAVRYGCASVLVDLTEKHPRELYPHMDFFISLLESSYRILVWNGLAAIANLSKVDLDNKTDAIADRYFEFLRDKYMVTVANVVGNSAKIALAKPQLVSKIADNLLSVEMISTSPHLTIECKRVIAEHAVKAFDQFFDRLDKNRKNRVISFVERQTQSPRASLKKTSELFLTHWKKGNSSFPKP